MIQEQEIVQNFLKIHPDDNVLVALKDIKAGTVIFLENTELIILRDIAAKHKVFIRDMHAGDDVVMYGTLVGKVQCDLSKGELMTTENTRHAAG